MVARKRPGVKASTWKPAEDREGREPVESAVVRPGKGDTDIPADEGGRKGDTRPPQEVVEQSAPKKAGKKDDQEHERKWPFR